MHMGSLQRHLSGMMLFHFQYAYFQFSTMWKKGYIYL
jgi:hypothetical protein